MTLASLIVTTLLFCIAGAIIPFLNTEVYLVGAVALNPPEYIAPLVVAASVGQMIGKILMFYGGRGIGYIKKPRVQQGVAALRTRLESRPVFSKLLLFASATVGLPPLYIMSIACGTIGMSVFSFVVIGTVGRLIHFAVVAMIPHYAKYFFG